MSVFCFVFLDKNKMDKRKKTWDIYFFVDFRTSFLPLVSQRLKQGTPRISVVEKELKTKYQHLCIIDLIISSIISDLKLAAFFHLVVHCHFQS